MPVLDRQKEPLPSSLSLRNQTGLNPSPQLAQGGRENPNTPFSLSSAQLDDGCLACRRSPSLKQPEKATFPQKQTELPALIREEETGSRMGRTPFSLCRIRRFRLLQVPLCRSCRGLDGHLFTNVGKGPGNVMWDGFNPSHCWRIGVRSASLCLGEHMARPWCSAVAWYRSDLSRLCCHLQG